MVVFGDITREQTDGTVCTGAPEECENSTLVMGQLGPKHLGDDVL